MTSKLDVALEYLATSSVIIHLDPRRKGVVVPRWLADNPQLALQVGRSMAVRIPDLVVDADGIRCTLRFNLDPFHCTIPWHAVFALRDEKGRREVWREDLPPEMLLPTTTAEATAATLEICA